MGHVAEARARDRPQTGPEVVGFVFQLELKRIALGLGQSEFAQDKLGIDRSVWYLIREGKTRPPWALIKRVLQQWPGEFDAYLPELIVTWGA